MPTIYVIAGPNGVGKTTFAERFISLEAKALEFVNADIIARELSVTNPESKAFEAGRLTLGRIRALIRGGSSFVWETTMSGQTAAGWLRQAREQGYTLKCYFLWVRNPETTLARIRQRIVEGGHRIPDDVVQRRFFKTIQNFFAVYRHLMDSWKFYASTGHMPRLIAAQKSGKLAVRDQRFLDAALSEAKIKI